MATVLPPGSGQLSQPSSSGDGNVPMTWEGDKMFNIYIYDYCSKRGFQNTARELLVEADISPDSKPPINARQGLLFEWWSVFWVLFTAKANGSGSDEAMLYTQHQAANAAQRQTQQRLQPHPPQPGGRPMNGMPRTGSGPAPPGFPLTNGVGPMGPTPFPPRPGQQQQAPGTQPQGQNPNAGQPPRNPNGAPPFHQSPTMAQSPSHQGGPQQQQQGQQQQQQQQGPPMGQLGPGPGPSPHLMNRGMAPPNGAQYGSGLGGAVSGARPPSRTNTPGGGMGMQGMQGGMMGHPSPGQGGGGPGGMQQTGMQGMMGQGQGSMMNAQRLTHPSPGLTARQLMGSTGEGVVIELSKIPQQAIASIKGELGLDKDVNSLSIGEKQKIVSMFHHRNMKAGPAGQGQKVGENAAAGPSNNMMQPAGRGSMSGSSGGQRIKRSSTSPGEEHETLPRTESSPPNAKRMRRSPADPQGQQQNPMAPMQYQHPHGQPQQHPSQQPQHGSQPQPQLGGPNVTQQGGGTPMGMSQNPMMMMRGPMPLGQGPMGAGGPMGGPMMGINGQPMNLGGIQMVGMPGQGGMGQGGMGGQGQGAMMTPNMMQHMQARDQYRTSLHNVHKQNMPGGGAAGSPASSDPAFNSQSFNPGNPNNPNRMGMPQQQGQQPGKPMGMMPPPSPAMGGPAKDKDGKGPGGIQSGNGGHPDGSPRNQGMGQTPGGGGTAPPTPVPNQQQQQQGQQQNPGQQQGQGMAAPSPSSILGVPPPNMGPPGQGPPPPVPSATSDLFSTDFIQSVASSLDDFDPSIFRPDGDINFERDFGQWFNHPDDVGATLDMK